MKETQEPCLAKIGKYWERADFIGVFQHSYTHGDSPMVGGCKSWTGFISSCSGSFWW